MRVLVAPQEFKGSLTAHEAASAIAAAIEGAGWQADLLPMADGGPGTTDALLTALGGERRVARVHDPLMRPIDAAWGVLSSGTAVIECAAASGLSLLRPDELDVRRATTYGTGELVRAALDAGCREVILGLGGSGTNDGGAGFAQALGFRFLDAAGHELPPGGAALNTLNRIDATAAHPAIGSTRFLGATDVSNPLHGLEGAAATFGPQKGADTATIEELDAAMRRLAGVLKRDFGADVADLPGTGAAGGLGAVLIALCGGELRPGAPLVAEAAGLEERIGLADLVLTGEGRLDGQTAYGKGPLHVAALARGQGRRVACLAGSLGGGHESVRAQFDATEVLAAEPPARLPPREEASAALTAATSRLLLRLGLLK
jgi:glycerate kinase